MATIHSTALVDPKAELDASVSIGPYCIVGPNVRIGAGTRLGPHVVVDGHTTLGCNNVVHGSATLGGEPQDKKYRNEPTQLVIGDGNTIREYCTINTGTVQDVGVTRVGNDNWIMAYVHIAHDCQVGSHTILANSVQLAGHVHVGDWVILGGLTGVHQYTRIGAHAMAAFQTKLMQDVPPFVMAAGQPAQPAGINSEGLKRRGFSAESIAAIKRAYKALYRESLSLEEAKASILAMIAQAQVDAATQVHLQNFLAFLHDAQRGVMR